jgi:hypothetical protein
LLRRRNHGNYLTVGKVRVNMLGMKFLKALLAQLSIGLVFRIGVPTMCAMIIEHFVTHPQIDDGFTRYPHPATFVIAGLFSSVCAALITSKGATD